MSCPSQALIHDADTAGTFRVVLQQRLPSQQDQGSFVIAQKTEYWKPERTAIIICDMWDRHWCKSATRRVGEMAPRIDEVISVARDNGALIVHAPSDCMRYYADYPQRRSVGQYDDREIADRLGTGKLGCEHDEDWPFRISGGGCDDIPQCTQGRAWTRQHPAITIHEGDVISDSGVEIGTFFKEKGIVNVILVGVHTNMCVIGRSFGLRSMVRLGMHVVLMRDLTDTMYDPASWPFVSHYTGNSLMHEYIEKYVCPTMVSSDFTGREQFRFMQDGRRLVAFVSAESEYRANQRLPEFAHQLLLHAGVNCDFALGQPVKEGPGRHSIENLQILRDADVAVLFVRRRALDTAQMALIRDYVQSGRPILGIRTASHAFDVDLGSVPANQNSHADHPHDTVNLASWPQFDRDILGGNYQGHYGHLKASTAVSVVSGMEAHPVLKDVTPSGFTSPAWLYKNAPLQSPNARVLLIGKTDDMPAEPVLWINENRYGVALYTSLGHWDDWENEHFRQIMLNAVEYLLSTKQD